jgi:hypothetical protein
MGNVYQILVGNPVGPELCSIEVFSEIVDRLVRQAVVKSPTAAQQIPPSTTRFTFFQQ